MNGSVVIRGDELPALLAVVPADAPLGHDLVPTAGAWARDEGDGAAARFTPRFAAPPGTVYAVISREAATGPWRRLAEVRVPRASVDRSTVVQAIDPCVEVIPANLLRFSVTFSAEIHEGTAAQHIHLRDAAGADLPGALLEMPPELWDRTRRRLTLVLEPGRIKRGLQPNVQAGPPLVEGSTVSLVIHAELQDARGQHLAAAAERVYRVGPPVRSRIDPARWQVTWAAGLGDATAKRAGGGATAGRASTADGAVIADSAQILVRFDRPLDRALANRYLRVRDAEGRIVEGSTTVNSDATEWRFVAAGTGIHWSLHVDTRLEDLAGNSVRRVFDRDLSNPADDGIAASEVVLTPSGRILLLP